MPFDRGLVHHLFELKMVEGELKGHENDRDEADNISETNPKNNDINEKLNFWIKKFENENKNKWKHILILGMWVNNSRN